MTSSPYRQLYRVVAASEVGRLSGSVSEFGLVVGALDRPFVVEEALGRLIFGRQVIGLDWADVRAIAAGRLGLAHVVPRGGGMTDRLIAGRDDLIARGSGAAFVLIEMFATTDEDHWDLQAHLELLEGVLPYPDRDLADTILLGSISASSVVLIGFPPSPTSEPLSSESAEANCAVMLPDASRRRSKMPFVMRNPWIGDRFQGLLIVGESHYGDSEDIDLTLKVVGAIVSGTWTHRFFTTVEQVVTGTASHGRGEDSFWHTVAFANFCPGGVDGPRHRPSPRMWEAGHKFLPELISTVRPRRMLVLGNETWDNFPAIKDIRSVPSPTGHTRDLARLTGETGAAADGVPITSIRHPASVGFSSGEWHSFYCAFVETMLEKAT